MGRLYRDGVFPLLARLDPERAHGVAVAGLERAQGNAAGRWMLRRIGGRPAGWPVEAAGLVFPNAIGVAAGWDKDARAAPGLAMLGFGHVEVGTLTPRPQPGNPRPRIFRLRRERALVNRMGFPNEGVEAAAPRLRAMAAMPRGWILGVSIGKQKETPIEEAARDYAEALRAVYAHADYIAANISSPNTPGLRALQAGDSARALCAAIAEEGARQAESLGVARRPVFVKLAPDLSGTELRALARGALDGGVDGFIAGNTTLSRAGVESNPAASEAGGLSGRPLRARATALVRALRRYAGGSVPIIAAGGVMTARDAAEKMEAGATLVQVYTGLVYEGPGIARAILAGLPEPE